MPQEINYIPEDRLILVRRYGETKIDDMRIALRSVKEISAKEGVHSALIDTRDVSSLPTIDDIYNFVTRLPDDIKFAIVIPLPNKQQRHDMHEFEKILEVQGALDTLGEIGKNHDKQVKVFENRDDAVSWLKENS